MRFSLHKLQNNLWLYFVVFALALTCVVWVCQVFFTERFFVGQIEAEVFSLGMDIEAKYAKKDEYPDAFLEAARDAKVNNYEIIIVPASYQGGSEGFSSEAYPSGREEMEMLFVEYSDVIGQVKSFCTEKNSFAYSGTISSNENKTGKLFAFAKRIYTKEEKGDDYYLIIITSLEQISSMVQLMQKQLAYISVIVIVIAFFVAAVVASSVAAPISEMSQTAKKLAEGDFSVEFKSNSYSEISELSDTLNYMKEELKRTGVLQRELLANVTHDLKTPLTMVKAYAEMIKDISGDNKEKRNKHAQVIIDEADRLTMLVNDILNLSKVQSGMDGLNLQIVDISALTQTAIDRFYDFSKNNGYTVNAHIKPGLFSLCDSMKIEQVVYNLIGNAINYTGEDKTVDVFLDDNGEGKILFEVVVSGKGIDADKIDTIWDKYYRASETHKRPVKGTGLGLSIVKAILEAHHLKYGVISEKNKGSNFFVELPAYDKDGNLLVPADKKRTSVKSLPAKGGDDK